MIGNASLADVAKDAGVSMATASRVLNGGARIAIGAMTALRDRGLRIPDDLAVAGFDDVLMAGDTVPALTTVGLPLVEACRTAVRVALDRKQSHANLAGTVLLRDSTPPRR